MTNLTYEGLRQEAQRLLVTITFNRDSGVPFEDTLNATYLALQQVRDAAKKEERERCAKVVEASVITRYYGNRAFHECSKDPIQLATAIRQRE